MTSLTDVVDVVIGVDTHVETHTAAAVDARTGAVLGQRTVATTAEGYAALVAFADDLAEQVGALRAWAVEGTASHGAGLTRVLTEREEVVVELDRPVRPARRNGAKSDPLDAVRAAREALARPVQATPRASGERQALSVLVATRRSAVEAAAVAQRQLFSLVIAAPQVLRDKLRGYRRTELVARAARLRLHPSWDTETATTATALRTLGRRIQAMTAEAAELEKQILAIVRTWRPDLLAQPGIGPIVAATVLCAWSHSGRIHSEAAFAMLAGAAPVPANSGQVTTRYRLNRHGDRQLNRALHTIVLTRQRTHQPTRDYTARRTSEGKTPREIRRCLKRYIARELFRLLEHPRASLDAT